MNPAIRALAQETDAWCDQNHIDSSGWGGTAWEEKFAELIVRACAQLADSCPAEYLAQAHKYPSTWILEHFGAE